MKKVKFNKWIPTVWPEGANSTNCNQSPHLPIKGTNCWETNFPNEGIFHQWGNAFTEFESNAGNYTVALVELADGTIAEVLPSNIQFIKEPIQDKRQPLPTQARIVDLIHEIKQGKEIEIRADFVDEFYRCSVLVLTEQGKIPILIWEPNKYRQGWTAISKKKTGLDRYISKEDE